MKILFKRSNSSSSTLTNSGAVAGEPIWFKDDLYIGSVGSAGGASGTAGSPIAIGGKTLNTKIEALQASSHGHQTITLSKSAQTYATIGTTNYTIQLPDTDPYDTPRTPDSHNLNSHSDVTISGQTTNDLLYYDNGWKNGTFTDIFGGTPLTGVGTLNTNNSTTQTANTSESFTGTINLHKISKTGSYNDLLNKPTIPTVNNATLTVQGTGLLGGSGTFTANASSNKTISITHDTREESSTTTSGSISKTSKTFTTKEYTFDDAGHESKVTTKTWTINFPTAAELGLSNAMHFRGTLTSLPTPTKDDTYANGDVVLVGNKEYVRSGKTASAAGSWVELGDGDSHALKTISITGDGALAGGGTLEANRTITHNTSGVTAGNYGLSTNATPSHGSKFDVPYFTVNDYGHVTSASTKTVTLPAQYSHPTSSASGSVGQANDATLSHGDTFKVPYVTVNNLGHVTAASTKTLTLPTLPSTMTPSEHTHGNVSNTGTLTDTAAAPASEDYIVIRDKSNNTIQTSNIDASKVSTLVSNLHGKGAGGPAKPVYFSGGEPTPCSSTVGGTAKPVYMNEGTITVCSSTVGNAEKPVYMSGGTITASNATVGSSSKPVYMNAGTITACDTIDGGTF